MLTRVSLAYRQPLKVRAAAAIVMALAAGAVTQSCTNAATVFTYTPITGIVVNSATLVAPYGCGMGDDQVFRYAAFLSYALGDAGIGAGDGSIDSKKAVATNIFDCFADSAFVNLPIQGGTAFELVICAYSEAAYRRAGLPQNLECAPGNVADGAVCQSGPEPVPCTAVAQPGGGVWTTHCHASQEQGVPVIASCDPLSSLSAPTTPSADAAATTTEAAADDGAKAPADAQNDATSEGAADGPAADSTAPNADGPLNGANVAGGGDAAAGR